VEARERRDGAQVVGAALAVGRLERVVQVAVHLDGQHARQLQQFAADAFDLRLAGEVVQKRERRRRHHEHDARGRRGLPDRVGAPPTRRGDGKGGRIDGPRGRGHAIVCIGPNGGGL
jgi:hypothetical protein